MGDIIVKLDKFFTIIIVCMLLVTSYMDSYANDKLVINNDSNAMQVKGLALPQGREEIPWLIYVYLVGSDLETKQGSATKDLEEILGSKIGKNVRVLVQTGGARQWQNAEVSSQALQIFEVSGGQLRLLKAYNNHSMGDPAVLANFLNVGEQLYKPKHRMIIFWDHGGGYTGGVGYDENFGNDFLEMKEITEAFNYVYQSEEKPFEIIGFDACLMANLSNAYYMSHWGHVMVASQELEPGTGWYYTSWLSDLENNPRISLRKLSEKILDSYARACEELGVPSATLSAVSLDKIPRLILSYNNFGNAVLKKLVDNYKIISTAIDRAAKQSDCYGNCANSNFESIDIWHFVQHLSSLAPAEAAEVKAAFTDAVIAKRNGISRNKSQGISVYYPLSRANDTYVKIFSHAVPTVFNIIYGRQIYKKDNTGRIVDVRGNPERIIDKKSVDKLIYNVNYVDSYLLKTSMLYDKYSRYAEDYSIVSSVNRSVIKSTDVPASAEFVNKLINASNISDTEIEDLRGIKISLSDNTLGTVKVPADFLEAVSSVTLMAGKYVPSGKNAPKGLLKTIGNDYRIREDWSRGIFRGEMDGTWPTIDGHILPVFSLGISDDFIDYLSFVKINNVPCFLRIGYDFEKQQYFIYGVQEIYKDGTPGRIYRNGIKHQDKLTTHYLVKNIETNTYYYEEFETFRYNSTSKITDRNIIGNEGLVYSFLFNDSFGNEVISEFVSATADGNKIKLSSYNNSLSGLNSDDEKLNSLELQNFQIDKLSSIIVDVNNNTAQVKIPDRLLRSVNAVKLNVCLYVPQNNICLDLGEDLSVDADWKAGVFREDWNGEWIHFGDLPVPLKVLSEDSDNIKYEVTAKINNNAKRLVLLDNIMEQVPVKVEVYDSEAQSNNISHAKMLKAGDEISLLYRFHQMHNNKIMQTQEVYSDQIFPDTLLIFNDRDNFRMDNIKDHFIVRFEFSNTSGYTVFSEPFHIYFDEKGGKVVDKF